MKHGTSHNNFTQETRFLFLDDNYWECWWCGRNHANCGHHIFGRGKEEGCESSPLNFAPLSNHLCHLPFHGRLTSDEGKKAMLEKTIRFLTSRGYRLTPLDEAFLEKYGREITRLNITI